jgi:hypothetical protein
MTACCIRPPIGSIIIERPVSPKITIRKLPDDENPFSYKHPEKNMGFQKEGMSVSRAFQAGGNKSGFTPKPRDRLVEVVGYNVGQSTMQARDTGTGKLMDVIVNSSRAAELSSKAQTKGVADKAPAWVGYLIDQSMANELPVGTRVVLEGTVPRGRPIKRGGDEFMQIECRYVSSASEPTPEKLFRAILTADSYDGRISSVQAWDEKALDTQDNRDDIVTFFDKMDEVRASYARQENPVGLGMQMRAVVPTGAAEDGTPTYEVIDTTTAFHWVAPVKDAAGNKVEDGHPMGKEDAIGLIDGYIGYLNDKFPEGTFDTDKDFCVEVMTFRNFKGSIQSKAMAVNERSPLGSLVTTPTKCAQDDEEYITGRNWAVDGIVALTRDVAPKKPGEPWVARNMVDKLFANGYRAHVASLVKTSDGGRAHVHPALNSPRVDREATAGAPAANAGARQASPASATPAAGDGFASDGGFGAADFGSGANAFEAAMAAPAASAPAASAQAPAASTPAAAPAAAAAETPTPANSFGSNQRPRRA